MHRLSTHRPQRVPQARCRTLTHAPVMLRLWCNATMGAALYGILMKHHPPGGAAGQTSQKGAMLQGYSNQLLDFYILPKSPHLRPGHSRAAPEVQTQATSLKVKVITDTSCRTRWNEPR